MLGIAIFSWMAADNRARIAILKIDFVRISFDIMKDIVIHVGIAAIKQKGH